MGVSEAAFERLACIFEKFVVTVRVEGAVAVTVERAGAESVDGSIEGTVEGTVEIGGNAGERTGAGVTS